ANDTFGYENSQSVSIYVDKLGPSITINSPNDNDVLSGIAPIFDVTITDGNLDTMWYFIEGSSVNRTFVVNEQFNQNDWDAIVNGTLTAITFFANDTFGYEISQSVSIYVDKLGPSITINSPNDNDVLSGTAPIFDVTITDGNLDTMWYFIEGSSVNRTFLVNEQFNQNDWDGIINGTLTTITFYANDTLGNENSQLVSIYVDNTSPSIVINSPNDNDVFSATAPLFDVTITDGNLDTMWYFIEGSSVNRTFLVNEQFNQNDWDAIVNGTLTTITFFANDTFGNENSQPVYIYVDRLVPSITVNSPIPNQLTGISPPSYDVTITDGNLDTMWYQLVGGTGNITFIANGIIDSGQWSLFGNGFVTIIFYANDTLGNTNSSQVTVIKSIDVPQIIINSPLGGQVFDATAPYFNVTILESDLDTSWYTINNGITNITFTGNNTLIQIDQNNWTAHSDGSFFLIIYANDSSSNIGSQQVSIVKDVIIPSITINSPSNNDIFGSIAPTFDVIITDGNLDTMWYFIEGSSVNRTFSGNEQFNQNDWDVIANGTLTTITFYANDSAGNINSLSRSIYVDRLSPSITINSPNDNDVLSGTAPVFDVTIIDGNLDTMWYFIEGSSVNRTFLGNEAFNQNDWDSIVNGTLTTITFYANDTLGNENTLVVGIYVDNTGPSIVINSPNDNDVFSATAPVFDVTITDGNLDTMWYFIEGSSVNRTFSGNEQFNQNDWDGILNGTLTMITFYANDTFGYETAQSVNIYVDNTGPSITINSPNDNDLLSATAPVFDVTITDGNLDTMWYFIEGSSVNRTFSVNEQFNQNDWDGIVNGTLTTITFYANDSAGNMNSQLVSIYVDNLGPSITINTPVLNQLIGPITPNFDITITDGNFDSSWYNINGTDFVFVGTIGTINQSAWDTLLNGTNSIRFYANDTMGNLNYQDVDIQKDILSPIITINSPTSNELFTHIIPQFDLTILEGNLNITWYTIDGGLTNYTFTGTSGSLNQAILNNGTITIGFYANDTLGNLGYSEVTIQFDMLSPKIFILSSDADSPDTDGLFVLNWTISVGADNYSVYRVELNSSLTLIQAGQTDLNYSMSLGSGTYYFLVRSYNETGFTDSNQLMITVDIDIAPEEGFDLISFLTNPLTLINFGIIIGVLTGVILKIRKKYYKSGDKEIKRIEEIRRREN
ncbi:MAG: beta strand repeat-containing protein, partial [Promethearchaeota archaeon]